MYLTTPIAGEFQNLEVPTLLDMLSEQTSLYFRLLHEEGFSDKVIACKEILINIQVALAARINSEKAINKEIEFEDH